MPIPRKIHYCWFGGNPLPDLAKKCIASWQKHLPDYEIIRWDELNYDINKIPYTREAYAAKKYAFVSDYARFDILYHHGGLYFDTDVELIKDMNDIIQRGAFMGCESANSPELRNTNNYLLNVAPGLGLGCKANDLLYKEILDAYALRYFQQKDGSCDLTTVVTIVTDILKKHGFNNQMREIQNIEGILIYPPDFFAPRNGLFNRYILTSNTYSIHHYAASWMSTGGKLRAALSKIIGYETYNSLKRLLKNNPNTKR